MMGRFIFDLATTSDDFELQQIIKAYPMGGEIRVSYQRHPSIFYSVGTLGKKNKVIVVRDMEYNKIVGFGIHSIRSVYINGEVAEIGYLSGLRLLAEYRRATLLGRAYSFLKTVRDESGIPFYISTVVEGNDVAIKTLTSQKGGIPAYHDVGRYSAFALRVRRGERDEGAVRGIRITNGCKERLGEVIEFLNRTNAGYQFAPHYNEDDFRDESGLFLGFSPENIYLALKKGRISGIIAKWDQRMFKQNIAAGYGKKLRIFRPFYNLVAKLGDFPELPAVGEEIKLFYVSMVAIENNDPEIFESLLQAVHNDNAGRDYSFMMIGFPEKHPLAKCCRRYHPICYHSRLYVVYWKDGEQHFRELDGRVSFLELATL